jgi:lipopolysaccharide/colanic/teichoic acid biosynthesis glycosyltransferase
LLDQGDASTTSAPAGRAGRRLRLLAGGAKTAAPPTRRDGDVDAPAVAAPATRRTGGEAQDPRLVAAERHVPVEPLGRLGLVAKRTVDLAGASVGLVVLGPFLLGVGALIALVDGRPVLFRQERAGRGERPFWIYKYRTMRNGADAERAALRARNEIAGGASFKMTHDPRVTRLGRLLRRTSVDEFPQLLNVLRGEMSLVGPRPHPFDDLAGYQPWHHRRFAVKPGMTGLWQVSSRRERDFDRWVELDLAYIRTWSPLLDIRIMARTIPAMLRGEGR